MAFTTLIDLRGKKPHMIILINVGKTFNKTKHSFTIKKINLLANMELTNPVKDIRQKPTAYSMLKDNDQKY